MPTEILTEPVLLLTLAMFLAIGTERLLEAIRALSEHLEARRGPSDYWQKKAQALRDRIEVRLDNANGGTASALRMVLSIVCQHLSPASASAGGLMAIDVERVRTMSTRVRYKLYAILIGVALAFVFQLDIFALVNREMSVAGAAAISLPGWLGMSISGVAMGFGAGPVHKIITALEQARALRK